VSYHFILGATPDAEVRSRGSRVRCGRRPEWHGTRDVKMLLYVRNFPIEKRYPEMPPNSPQDALFLQYRRVNHQQDESWRVESVHIVFCYLVG